ncbi:BTAD domain-containing putative transcriptional regulator [Symbiobacterium thermophilum]|uniref:BTAD domain-containing putative transcriptional regulator n=1 Tax=Symbiobacterium thermophilum TaxID=2734 RepID=UPI0002E709DB|nr:BTAD domain-containing putative transcriptional regulator [Symbiobacterium thermophilum]
MNGQQTQAAHVHLPRPHLTARLQEGLTRRLTVLLAPAGYGKTSALRAFVGAAGLPVLWLDRPFETEWRGFLQQLGEGVARELRGGTSLVRTLYGGGLPEDPLPLLLADLSAVAGDHVLVFDDLRPVPGDSPVADLIGRLAESAGERTHIYIAARAALPFPTVRLKLSEGAGEITEQELRFRREEMAAWLTAATGEPPSAAVLDRVEQLTEGWPAALVLLTEAARQAGGLAAIPAVDDLAAPLPEDLTAYLADEVMEGLDPAVRSFMEESAILNFVTPAACEALLGRRDSEQMVDRLCRVHRLLVPVGPGVYRYPSLLQRFLLGYLRTRGPDVLNRLSRMCIAPAWLAEPEPDRLSQMAEHLSPAQKAQYPWVALCEARYLLNAGQAERAMGIARLALRSCEQAGDRRGVFYSHVLLSDCLFLRRDFARSQEHLAEAASALQPEFRDDAALLALKQAVLAYMTGAGPEELEAGLRTALVLYVESGDLIGEAEVLDVLGMVRVRRGDYRSGLALLERSSRLLRAAGIPEHETGLNLAWACLESGRFQDACRLSRPLATGSRKVGRRAYALLCLLIAHTRLGEFTAASALVPLAHAAVEELGLPHLRAWLNAALAALHRLSGEAPAAAPDGPGPEGAHVPERVEAVMLHLFFTGDARAAAQIAAKTLETLQERATALERTLLSLGLAVARFRTARTESRREAVQALQRALAECQRRGTDFFVLHEWQLALAVVVYGLAYNVQPAYCVNLLMRMAGELPASVRLRGIRLAGSELRALPTAWRALSDEAARTALAALLPAEQRQQMATLESGPTLITIRLLGPLAVRLGDAPVDLRALKRRKTGQLLALLLAQDGPLPREQIIERLWPDLTPRAAHTSLRVALHHLRRLLEPHLGGRTRSSYIQAEGGLIWFQRRPEVWVDLDQFRRTLQQAEAARAAGRTEEAARLLEEVGTLYRGDLLSDDPYALGDLRDRWRQRWAEALDWLGHYYWLEAGRPDKAIHAFQRRLALEEYHEPTHQALMRIYLNTGQPDRARQQYRACAEALAAHLGVSPSPVTESLLQTAVAGGAGKSV